MSYREMRVYAGKTLEVKKYYCFRNKPKGETRGKKIRETDLSQQEVNRKNCEDRLRWLLNCNFCGGDYHLVLRYKHKEGEPYATPEKMRADIKRFLRKMRVQYKKEDLEFKYIYVLEIGARSSRHIHIVMNAIDIKKVRECWEHGYITCTPLDNSGDYRLLASYLIKYSDKTFRNTGALMGKRYSCSRNLAEPRIIRRTIKRSDSFKEQVNPVKGYFLDVDSIDSGFDCFGYRFFKYTMVRLE